MKPKRFRPSRRQMQPLCGEIRADDGVDPRDLFRSSIQPKDAGRKARQLCSQVADTLNLVLGGASGDALLCSLQVVAVTPAPDASQLLVLVGPAVAGDAREPAEVVARLAGVAGRLRAEVASAITRRRAPRLLFQYVSGAVPAEGT